MFQKSSEHKPTRQGRIMCQFFIFVFLFHVFVHDRFVLVGGVCTNANKNCIGERIYDTKSCSCICKEELRADCEELGLRKIWDEKTCSCLCRNSQSCDPQYEFDHDICKCSPIDGLNTRTAIPANCEPHLEVISFEGEHGNQSNINPPCTRVKRCSGCCSDTKMSCQPKIIKIRNFELTENKLLANGTRVSRRVIKSVEEHEKCACGCKVRPEHCTSQQSYDVTKCECYCPRNEDEHLCADQKDIKVWNRKNCSCECKSQPVCPTGFDVSQKTCKCFDAQRTFLHVN